MAFASAIQQITGLIVGATYRVSATVTRTDNNARVYVTTDAQGLGSDFGGTGVTLFNSGTISTPRTFAGSFVATATSHYISLLNYSFNDGVVGLDNVSVVGPSSGGSTVTGAPLNGGRSQVNPGNTQTGGDFPFLNLLKSTQSWSLADNGASSDPSTLDDDGYPISISNGGVQSDFFVPTQAKRPGNYIITWSGNGTHSTRHEQHADKWWTNLTCQQSLCVLDHVRRVSCGHLGNWIATHYRHQGVSRG